MEIQLLLVFENHVFTGTAEDFLLHPVHSSPLRLGRTAAQPFLALQLYGSNFFKMLLNPGGSLG